MNKIVRTRKIVIDLLTYVPAILVGLVVSYQCQKRFGLSLLQTNVMTFAFGGVTYYAITAPLVNRYLEWSVRRDFRSKFPSRVSATDESHHN
ncbi:hypothetical protein [Paraburkholderia sp. GAS32]|uniref:hypothetical protein n=1 Tax=Paraburkholderia sp. GAS32 TaxID=3035129 RepID=UPI003D225F4D